MDKYNQTYEDAMLNDAEKRDQAALMFLALENEPASDLDELQEYEGEIGQ